MQVMQQLGSQQAKAMSGQNPASGISMNLPPSQMSMQDMMGRGVAGPQPIGGQVVNPIAGGLSSIPVTIPGGQVTSPFGGMNQPPPAAPQPIQGGGMNQQAPVKTGQYPDEYARTGFQRPMNRGFGGAMKRGFRGLL